MKARLISNDGHTVAETDLIFPVQAVLFSTRVFLYMQCIGEWAHYREVTVEQVRLIEVVSHNIGKKQEIES